MSVKDLDLLPDEGKIEYLAPKIKSKYLKYKKNAKCRILRTFASFFAKQLLFILFLTIAFCCISVAIPICLQNLIDSLTNYKSMNGILEIGRTFLFLILISLSEFCKWILYYQVYFLQNQMSNKIMVSIIGNIFEKVLNLKKSDESEISTGEIENLIQTDSLNVSNFFSYYESMANSFFLVVFSSITLFYYLNLLAFVTVACIAIFILANIFLFKKLSYWIKSKLKDQDGRLKYTSEVLSNIKVTKMYAWIDAFESNILKYRNKEVGSLFKVLFYYAFVIVLYYIFPQIVDIVTFISFSIFGTSISVGSAYAIINLIASISIPIQSLPDYVIQAMLAFTSSGRIESFLDKAFTTNNQLGNMEKNSRNIISEVNEPYPIEIYPQNYDRSSLIRTLDNLAKESIILKDCTFALKPKISKHSHMLFIDDLPDSKANVSEVLNNSVSSGDTDMPIPSEYNIILKEINLQIQRKEFVMIIGEIGSGKTSLINGINDEMINIKTLSKGQNRSQIVINGKVAYVEQSPWIQSVNIRDNICFLSEVEKEKLDHTIKVCQLEEDLKTFPNGLLTEIGERGTNLSGGQKMRISIARAVYSDADIFILDDPLSSLDSDIKSKIMDDCIGDKLKGKTILMSTHCTEFLNRADKIIYLKNNQIEFFGKYDEFISSSKYSQLISDLSIISKSNLIQENQIKENEYINTISQIKFFSDEEVPQGRASRTVYLNYMKLLGGSRTLIAIIFVILGWCILNSF